MFLIVYFLVIVLTWRLTWHTIDEIDIANWSMSKIRTHTHTHTKVCILTIKEKVRQKKNKKNFSVYTFLLTTTTTTTRRTKIYFCLIKFSVFFFSFLLLFIAVVGRDTVESFRLSLLLFRINGYSCPGDE